MKATERAKRFAADDRVHGHAAGLIIFELNYWSAGLGVAAAVFVFLAATSGGAHHWYVGGGCALGSLLCWMLARSG